MAERGMNLGGWLVSEKWMTRSLYDGVHGEGERALGQELGMEEARRRLTAHRDTFITEDDFAELAAQGFTFVRLPVGYWTFEEDTDFVPGEEYVERAFEWADRHHIGIVLDFHGLQGSQNGNDHSGQVGEVRFYEDDNIGRALGTVEYMAQTYGRHPALMGLELINEPKLAWPSGPTWPGRPARDLNSLMDYYARALEITARHMPPDVKVIVGDGFQPERVSRELGRRGLRDRVVLDVHHYQCFSEEDKRLTYQQHIDKANREMRRQLSRLGKQGLIMVGEWSAVLPDRALQGMDETARQDAIRQYYNTQLSVFDGLAYAQSYWSYKAPGNGPWDYRSQDF